LNHLAADFLREIEWPEARHGGRIIEVPLGFGDADEIANAWIGAPSGSKRCLR
jgi:hypothetical protein